jgi:hypothetical protein
VSDAFKYKTQFTVEQAACAIVGVTDPREKLEEVRHWEEELELTFPPIEQTVTGHGYGGPSKRVRTEPAMIPRARLLAWCEEREIHPPLLFPETIQEDLDPRARKSLLILVAVLREQAKKSNKASAVTPKAIEIDSQKFGIPLSTPTITKWLNEAEKLIKNVKK